ncbi:MAG TPA: hypothetical protein VMH34_08105 [Gammaproteobacteria bacterium]|nr:hypothetical protein [Gammaproteobacteria bacterium]
MSPRLMLLQMSVLCVAFSAAGPVSADPLGRLFTTPAEREELQRLRTAPPVVAKPGPPPAPVAEAPAPPPEVPPVTVNGVVVRSHGEGTAWVNGKNTYDGDLSADHVAVDTRGLRGARVTVETPGHLPDVGLKPGQTYHPETGQITDLYNTPENTVPAHP